MQIHCKFDELVSPLSLKFHPKNANNHPKDQIERLAKILNYQGWRYPIKVSRRSGFVTSGHGRIQAALLNGWKEVPVNHQDYEDDDQELADVHSDNAIASWAELDLKLINAQMGDFDPGFDIDLLGIKDFTLDVAEKEFGSDEDEVPEAPPEPVVKRGELWILGEHRLLIDDCTVKENVERLMAGEKADMVFTDPPYGDFVGGFRMKTAAERSNKPGERGLVKRVTTIENDGAIEDFSGCFRVIDPHLSEVSTKMVFFKWNKWEQIKSACSHWGEPSAVCVWDRERFASAFFRFNPVHEFVFHWGSQEDKRKECALTNVWRGKKELDNKELHPTVKPQEIIQPAIEVCSSPGERILDPFLGSGSTLIACEKTNRRCFGMEIDPHYGQVIIERYLKFTGRNDVYRLEANGHKTPWSEVAPKHSP
jgi:DNA modification methylase